MKTGTGNDQTRVTYSALPPGKYTFNVIASNSQGIWNSKPVRYHFVIMPPFYLTWWFILLFYYGNSGYSGDIYKNQRTKPYQRKIILEKKVKERTEEVCSEEHGNRREKQGYYSQHKICRTYTKGPCFHGKIRSRKPLYFSCLKICEWRLLLDV